jgi:hypothetical protein
LASLNANGTPLFPNVGPLGGFIAGVPVLISPAAANRVILFDQARIARWDGGLELETSTECDVEFLTNPTNNSATATHTTVTSAFQCNTSVLRFIRHVSWLAIDVDHASYITLDLGGSPA